MTRPGLPAIQPQHEAGTGAEVCRRQADRSAVKGRGAGRADRESSRKAPDRGKVAKKLKGRTVYLSDDLFERILVQAHRRDKTIREYVSMILGRQVPDHRTIRTDSTDGGP